MSDSLDVLLKKQEELQAQIDKMRVAEFDKAIEQVKNLIIKYQITPADLGIKAAPKKKVEKKEPVFQNKEGDVWSGGGGRKPDWVRAILDSYGKDIEKFNAAMEKFRIKK